MSSLHSLIITSLVSILFVSKSFQNTYLCDLKSIDNVFNIGHLIYMSRCGEVWTYDPRMNGIGGFIRDYSWQSFGRKFFGESVIRDHKSYEDKFLHFTAFSFQEINCDKESENIEKDCSSSMKAWNGLTVMLDKYDAYTFKYDTDYQDFDPNNPLGFIHLQRMQLSNRSNFWPDLQDVAVDDQARKLELGNDRGYVHSALFAMDKLFLVLRTDKAGKKKDLTYFCITYADMKNMLHDVTQHPKQGVRPNWAKCSISTGNVVGMFYHETKGAVYVVGRIGTYRNYEDQVNTIKLTNGNGNGNGHQRPLQLSLESESPHLNMRTMFGCTLEEVSEAESEPRTRKKRSVESESVKSVSVQPLLDWDSIKQEIREDWISLSLMSVTALALIVFIVKTSQQIHFK